MSNEHQTTEAEAKKPGTLTDGIDHMIKVLEQAADEARRAIGEASLMPRDGMKWMRLSKAVHDVHELTRSGWYKLVDPPAPPPAAGTGAFFTSPEVMKVLKDAEKKPFTTASLASIPELGIEFHPFHTKDYYKFICFWKNDQEPNGRVYELTVKPSGAATDGAPKWRARGQTGGKSLYVLEAASKRLAIECGLVAMRRYLIRGHRAAWNTYRKSRGDGVPS